MSFPASFVISWRGMQHQVVTSSLNVASIIVTKRCCDEAAD
jgi:hypothetical protein